MQLENKILIDHDWRQESSKFYSPLKGDDYLVKCLVEKNINFHIDDWKKLSVKTISKKDILYAPFCNIPEHKMEEKYPEVTFTKDLNLATKFVISDQLLARIYNFKTTGEQWKYNLRTYLFREIPTSNIYRFREIRDKSIRFDKSIDYVYVRDQRDRNNPDISLFRNYPLVYIKPYKTYNFEELSGTLKQIKYTEQLLQAKSAGNIEFIFESTLLESLNADSNVIDKQFYNNLCAMLESENIPEHRLAYEVLANCDIEKSKIYVLLILNTYAYKLNRLEQEAKRTSDKKIKNKNYKSVLSYLNLKPADLLLNWDTFSGKIVEKCNLSNNDILILKEHLIDKLNKKYNHTNFKIESICLTEK